MWAFVKQLVGGWIGVDLENQLPSPIFAPQITTLLSSLIRYLHVYPKPFQNCS
jgi:hypothetical protein